LAALGRAPPDHSARRACVNRDACIRNTVQAPPAFRCALRGAGPAPVPQAARRASARRRSLAAGATARPARPRPETGMSPASHTAHTSRPGPPRSAAAAATEHPPDAAPCAARGSEAQEGQAWKQSCHTSSPARAQQGDRRRSPHRPTHALGSAPARRRFPPNVCDGAAGRAGYQARTVYTRNMYSRLVQRNGNVGEEGYGGYGKKPRRAVRRPRCRQ
jgi:hypothetical protein